MLSRAGDAAPMQWDGVTLKELAGIAAVIISGVVLLAGVRPVVPMMRVVARVAAMFGARVERLKLRVETLEKKPRVAVAVEGYSCSARGSAHGGNAAVVAVGQFPQRSALLAFWWPLSAGPL